MIEIEATAVAPTLRALFDPAQPTLPRALAVLDGAVPGRVLVDDPDRPRWLAVQETTYGTLYPGGRIDAPQLHALIAHLRRLGPVGLSCRRAAPLSAWLPPDPDYDGTALYFPERSAAVALQPLLKLPPGYTLAPRDARWLPQSPDYEATLAAFGSAEAALRATLGVVVLEDELVVCEAATGPATHGRIEVGVTTAADHRRRGLATAACASLIMRCEAQGYATWWDCGAQNSASRRLANTLGYRRPTEYRYILWERR